jgi:hypothetical protein
MISQLLMRIGILVGKHLYAPTIFPRGEILANKANIPPSLHTHTLTFFIEVSEPSQVSELSCICVLGIPIQDLQID